MTINNYTYKINSLTLKGCNAFTPSRINVFVGANNCGKTQLLKDMLTYITGSSRPIITLDNMDIRLPNTWEEMEKSYNMFPHNTYGDLSLRHISPTLDTESQVTSSITNFYETLNDWLKNDTLNFRRYTGPGLVTYLNTDNRLKLAMRQKAEENLHSRGAKNVLEALYLSGHDSSKKVTEYINKIFGKEIVLNPYNLGSLEFRVGTNIPTISDFHEGYELLSRFPLLDSQGDGIRSATGIITAIISINKPIILLDEPEAFLHPPQAFQLGELISSLVNSNQQIFIATHSTDFLRGLISTTTDATIIHIDRSINDIITSNILDAGTLTQIVTNPLLSSSRVLDGMFYKGVVATEADADAIFYQRAFQKIGAGDEIHFINAHNKQTLKTIITPYQKLGIRFALIADADVIRDKHEFTNILQITNDVALRTSILNNREDVINYFQRRNKIDIFKTLQVNTKSLAEQSFLTDNSTPDDIEKALYEFRLNLKKLRDDSDSIAELKKNGRASLPEEIKNSFDILWESCASIGLFIVNVGELESWLIDYGIERKSNKTKWITEALYKLFAIEYDENKELWKFINSLRNYLIK